MAAVRPRPGWAAGWINVEVRSEAAERQPDADVTIP